MPSSQLENSVPVFPVRVWHDGKKWQKQPLVKGWLEGNRRPRDQWNGTWPAAANAEGVIPADLGCVVIDLDLHQGVDETILAELPDTYTVRTPSGGGHLWYATDQKFNNSKPWPGVDIRCAQGFVPLPGSCDKYKVLIDCPFTPLPAKIAAQLHMVSDREPLPAAADLDLPHNIARARLALEAIIKKHGLLGEHDEPETYRHVCTLKDIGISAETCLDMLVEFMGEGERDWLRTQVRNAYRYGQNEPGAHAAPERPDSWLPPADEYTADWWRRRAIPERVKLIGCINRASRTMLVAPTGAGKTMFAMALAASLAAGTSIFARGVWQAPKPMRVLYIDGEMPLALLRERLIEAVERAGDVGDRMTVLTMTDFRDVGPLNSAGGQDWVNAQIARFKPDLVIFDNVACLTMGDQKDTEIWASMKAWQRTITDRDVAQLWIAHANADGSTYGDKTREFEMDTVIVLTPIEGQTAFDIAFRKSRERHPGKNDKEYLTGRAKLEGGRWYFKSEIERQQDRARAIKANGENLTLVTATKFAELVAVSQAAISKKDSPWQEWREPGTKFYRYEAYRASLAPKTEPSGPPPAPHSP